MNAASNRVLVSVVPEAKARIQTLFPDCDLEFVDSYADAALAIKSHRYGAAVIGVHLGATLVESLARLIAEIQPSVRIIAVAGVDRGPIRMPTFDSHVGIEGPFDVSSDPLARPAQEAISAIVKKCAR